MNLRQALRADQDSIVSIVGAGGKTTTMFQLARQLEKPVLVTCTTHLGSEQAALADEHLAVSEVNDAILRKVSSQKKIFLVTQGVGSEGRLQGLNEKNLDALATFAARHHIPIVIEADGARQLSLKAPAEHEPAIPDISSHVVVLVGLSTLRKPLSADYVHRPEIFSKLSGRKIGKTIRAKDIAAVLENREGGLKNIPKGCRKTVLLNQAGTEERKKEAEQISKLLIPAFDSVVIAELQQAKIFQVEEKVSGIILAAGKSERFGTPKQIALWQGKPLIRHVVENALESSLAEVIVVLGANDAAVREVLEGLPVKFARNEKWQTGQASSLKAGLDCIDPQAGAALFLLCDQPQIGSNLIDEFLRLHSQTLAAIIAPEFEGKRGNPVLFDRDTFSAIKQLQGDFGGRLIFAKFSPMLFPWRDPRILIDIDTPEDLKRLG